jgi:hypothetical protein
MKLTEKHKALINDYMRLSKVQYNRLGFTCNLIHDALGRKGHRIYTSFFDFVHYADDEYNEIIRENEKYILVLPDHERTQLRSLLLTVFMETYNDCI